MTTHVRQIMSLGLLSMLLLSSCSAPSSQTNAPSSQNPSPSTSSSQTSQAPGTADREEPTPAPSQQPTLRQQAEELADQLSTEQQAASLVMAGVSATGAGSSELKAMKKQGLSNVFLRGRSHLSIKQTAVEVAAITKALKSNVPDDLPVWVATDQEGGFVRVLQGDGFTKLPTASKQGQWPEDKLSSAIKQVGEELTDAGINLNLAPVADVVPAKVGTGNAPIGYFGREYGATSGEVSTAITTVNDALNDAGVQPVVKHFPGLGRVAKNTDVSSGVTDTVIGIDASDLEPFKQAIAQDNSWVMISNARYTKIDATNDAPFSSKLISGLLRNELGYQGVVISDDLCEAKQVAQTPVGQRAIKFVAAGGTVPLCVKSGKAITMVQALGKEAKANPKFAKQVRAAATLVLEAKLRQRS